MSTAVTSAPSAAVPQPEVTRLTAARGPEGVPAVVLVGASAGGLTVLRGLLAGLPSDLQAAVVAVVHQPSRPQQALAALLAPVCPLPVREAGPVERLVAGQVLLAPPDHHLEVVDGELRRSDGPRCNGVRPSVDVLFASAAAVFRRRVVAVVLSGAMRDGAHGAAVVERAGGQVLVQDPDDACVSGMPRSALAATTHHEVAPAARLPDVLARLVAHVVRQDA
ncbi:chemotaxis protein CheB [Jannaschia sp. R86511]|uniref:chemotaxis protein CheB n=1 Tax=Jannaschia sp. R86511 TaxID=3093853 RepID=UPI0036D23349